MVGVRTLAERGGSESENEPPSAAEDVGVGVRDLFNPCGD
jgi:hypothetical protein